MLEEPPEISAVVFPGCYAALIRPFPGITINHMFDLLNRLNLFA
jgi:hypothetical protein